MTSAIGMAPQDAAERAKFENEVRRIVAAGNEAGVASQVEAALAALDAAPKPLAWKMRDKIGDRVKWYKDVEEVK